MNIMKKKADCIRRAINNSSNKDFFKFVYFSNSAQAIIYSRNARSKLSLDISSSNFNKGHIDSIYIQKLNNKFTYKYPLIVQLLTNTENQNIWTNNILRLYIIYLTIALLRLDTHTDNWFLLYFICRNYISILILLIILIIICGMFYFKINNRKISIN